MERLCLDVKGQAEVPENRHNVAVRMAIAVVPAMMDCLARGRGSYSEYRNLTLYLSRN